MNFCSHCGEKVVEKIPHMDNRLRHMCFSCDHIHYKNPKIVTGILPIFEDKILLCKRAIAPQKGLWTIPAGFMENNESLEQGALREADEEAGIDVNIEYVHSIYSIPSISQVYIIFLGTLQNLDYNCGIETLEIALFDKDTIPWDLLAFDSITFVLKKYLEDCEIGWSKPHLGAGSI
jgi:ADP-ribose pyrophosphatase YjhB (NUDIX family)